MNWTDLITTVAARAGTSIDDTREVLNAFVDVSTQQIVDGERVVVRGLGTLGTRWVGSRTLRSVSDGRKLRLDGRHVAQFRPSRSLKQSLVKQSPQLWRDERHQKAWKVAETLVADLALYHPTQAPKLDADAPSTTIQDACSASFGPLWARVRTTYEAQVPAEIRASKDYLALAAHSRWA
ncbi:MAG: HU family DNA-binding protein [Myxococcota bacterium]